MFTDLHFGEIETFRAKALCIVCLSKKRFLAGRSGPLPLAACHKPQGA